MFDDKNVFCFKAHFLVQISCSVVGNGKASG